MTQLALFEELPSFHGFKGEHGAHWASGQGRGVCRNWRGYLRHSESGQGAGAFYVSAFGGPEHPDGSDSTAHVLMIREDGTTYTEPHHITQSGRLCIMGQKYSRDHWDH